MQRTTVVTALVTAVVFAVAGWLAGSHSGKMTILKHPHGSKDCRDKDCGVTIKFDCVNAADPGTCEPYAVEEVIQVTPNHKIEFTIDNTTNYEFADEGVKFTSDNSNGHFDCQSQGKQKYKCDIKNGTPADLYKYWIQVHGMSRVDPWVVNR